MQNKISKKEFVSLLKGKANKEKLALIMLAYKFAKYGHRGQKRDNGARYFEHPRKVAVILIKELKIYDHEMIIAALLHDIIEDSFILSNKEIGMIFGKRVKKMVEILTKPKKNPSKLLRNLEYYFKLAIADKDVVTIKLADRLANLRDLKNCSKAKIEKQIKETKEIYIPLSNKVNFPLHKKIARSLNEANYLLGKS